MRLHVGEPHDPNVNIGGRRPALCRDAQAASHHIGRLTDVTALPVPHVRSSARSASLFLGLAFRDSQLSSLIEYKVFEKLLSAHTLRTPPLDDVAIM